ncbi:MAG: aminotransferase class I/II-fold pyridoxal phosphate-dependent enzyme [bacterium]
MIIKQKNIEQLFELYTIKPGKISEISEATAASSVPPAERVNFHIGNPVQDESLTRYYLNSLLGVKTDSDDSEKFDAAALCRQLGWDTDNQKRIEFLYNVTKNSAPYSPRGGFNIKNPVPLVKKIHQWLTAEQDEPLSYDLGEKSGKRELLISSGGIDESLRILFYSLNSFLVNLPANIFYLGGEVPVYASDFNSLIFSKLPDDESDAVSFLEKFLKSNNEKPGYLVIDKIITEEIRRRLRNLCLDYPLFFIETNDVPNHLSLSREAKLKNRVIRFLTPRFISEKLTNLSIVVLAGDSELLKIFESVHFQLKGTPSASEIELLQYLSNNFDEVANCKTGGSELSRPYGNIDEPPATSAFTMPLNTANKLLDRIEEVYQSKIDMVASLAKKIERKSTRLNFRNISFTDHLINKDTHEVLDEFFQNIDNDEWINSTTESFVTAFVKEHPEYSPKNLIVVNGSSRTALGLLGFHCGISEVIAPDFSWTYEHCFPKSTFIPLTDEFEIDVDMMCRAVDDKLVFGKDVSNTVAVVLNNPHNASGKIFRETDLKELLVKILDRNVFVIDDLAYQNVLPENSLNGPKTLKQLALELVKEGRLYKDKLNRLIVVHSLSKTDCFAGARLAVVEINDDNLAKKLARLNSIVKPNIAAILTAYLFYRNNTGRIQNFWLLRNRIFKAKMDAIAEAESELPPSRNPFHIYIQRPQGSMYPRMVIDNLPNGLSLDWLSSGLAAQGIGLVPLASFARTSKGYELGRKSFRLTLGGTDSPEILLRKTRRVLIDMNRLIAEEKAKYNKRSFSLKPAYKNNSRDSITTDNNWNEFLTQLNNEIRKTVQKNMNVFAGQVENRLLSDRFFEKYLPYRLRTFSQLFHDRFNISRDYLSSISKDGSKFLVSQLEYEFYKDDAEQRREKFRKRSFDRTVHPTQMYAIDTDILFNIVTDKILRGEKPEVKTISQLSECLTNEYLGRNVSINSAKEGEELVCDLRSIIAAEQFTSLYSTDTNETLLSFWGDWDGSNRPSGQGHRLVAAAVLENVTNLSSIIVTLVSIDKTVKVDPELLSEINQLSHSNKMFWELLNKITTLTNQLEKRYRSVLPFSIESNRFRKAAMKIHLAQDPIVKLWQHNDRLEAKMLALRSERRNKLEYYFKLNKQLRKTLHDLIPFIIKHSSHQQLILQAGLYRDVLKRFVLTPRIHQKLITAKDQFAINTTVHNIFEINEIAGSYGNPGMVLGLQVSMSTNPEALIALDKKFVSEREDVLKKSSAGILPKVWSIPLFEDLGTVEKIESYLDKVWDYAVQSRSIEQDVKDRFSEIVCEVFIAGSDLSQQVGQTSSTLLYNRAKHKTIEWLAKKGLSADVRIKLGCGEPMQRQGGYYADFSSKPAFVINDVNKKRFKEYLKESTVKSTEFAVTPLHGVFAGGDLRTMQSAVSEKARQLSANDRAQLLYHLNKTQQFYHNELIRASEPFVDTRLIYESKGLKELERLTLGKTDDVFNTFAQLSSKNFQQIIYGSEDDVVGIHIISYFLSRATPILRDRPVDRPSKAGGDNRGQKILERIASTIPLCKHGSLLRAISHNKTQTFILGINQLTTGLFRALNQFSQQDFPGGRGYQLLADKILPGLPVYEILATMRLFQDFELKSLKKFSDSFPSGNSAFTLLREDMDSFEMFAPMLQKELLRRHGINVEEFFEGDKFILELLPTLRPDLAVLLQPDFFNIEPEKVLKNVRYEIPKEWLDEFSELIIIPKKIRYWRNEIWKLLEEPVKNQVKSFVELAIALNSLSKDIDMKEFSAASSSFKNNKYETSLTDLLKGKVDDSMRQFLTAAVQYLTRLPSEMVEVPIDIVRALKDVERILQIEEQALSKNKQELLNFYLLQIARYVGDNG